MAITPQQSGWPKRVELQIESFLLWLRWVLAPAYVILGLCLFGLVGRTFYEFYNFILALGAPRETDIINAALLILDLVLVSNLLLMVLLVGYVTFVSHIDFDHKDDKLKWIDTLDYTGLKVQVIGSIIAVSAIKLLRAFMDIFGGPPPDYGRIYLLIIVHLTFLGTAVVIAVIGKLRASTERSRLQE
ncbi:MAG TPA: YqhA family protein [Xanthobacteraceae bacterium]|nr:YqhA family protein [Xanthobacteraceae bacterium]